ncbi:hypothetical protein [Joostella sp. CR20]|uniref:hypothetical protein n=1 Tax=Joostella sp. CR20 TaxID=2804312 RepID=UPI00313C15DF
MQNYCLNKGVERLKQFEIAEFEEWYYDKLIYYNDYPNIDYWKTLPHTYHEASDVPLKKVIGTNHINYANNTWLENLGCLKRFSSYYTREYSTKYFDSEDRKPTNSYAKFGDDYIITEGNHRTHSAKFLGYESIKGHVTEYFFDHELFNSVNDYKKEKLSLTIPDNIYSEAIWNLEIENIQIYIHGYKMLKSFIQLYKDTPPSWYKSKKLQLNHSLKLSNTEDYVHIKNQEDLSKPIFKLLPAFKYNKLIADNQLLFKQIKIYL